jgi:hypothetical protein
MEPSVKIDLLYKRLQFLNTILAGALSVGDMDEIEKASMNIKDCQIQLEELLKQQEDANRESELPVG